MSKMKLCVLSLLILSGCTSSYYLKPIIETDKMDMVLLDGKEVALIKGEKSGIAIYGIKTEKNELVLHVLYYNNSTEDRINVIPENISVVGVSDLGKRKSFHVFSAEEYLKKMRNAQMWALILQGAAGAMEASQAGKSTSSTYGSASGTLYGSDGTTYSGYGSTYSTTTTTDYGAQAEANARNTAELQKTAELYAQTTAATEQGLLKANTVFPEQYVEGNIMVKMDPYYSTKFIVTIPVENEIHKITFIQKQ